MKRKIKGISVLFVAIIILALAVETNAIGMSRSAEEIVIGLKEESYIKLKELIILNNGEVVKTISTSKEIVAIVAKVSLNLISTFEKKQKMPAQDISSRTFGFGPNSYQTILIGIISGDRRK